MTSFDLYSPFVTLTFSEAPKHWKAITAVWIVFWMAISAGALYAYVVMLPEWIGFHKTVLVGLGLTILGTLGGESA